jgi:hypothetical protein
MKGVPVPPTLSDDTDIPSATRHSLLARFLDRFGGVCGEEFWQIIAAAARGELKGYDRTTGDMVAKPTVSERVDAAKFIIMYQHGKPKESIQIDGNLRVVTKWDPSVLTPEELETAEFLQRKIEGKVVDALPPSGGAE